nr:hypothetical protein [Tanacetum cinerariifolium]
MSYLTDYEEIDGGYVAFLGNPEGGKITSKGKFDGKADEGFFVGYSINSKVFRTKLAFDIDALTKSMNYKPVVTRNQSNGNAGTKACDDAGKARVETVPGKDYILLPLCDNGKKADEDLRQESECHDQEKLDNVNSTNNVNADGTNRDNAIRENTNNELPFDPEMPELEDISTFNFSNEDEDDGAEADMNNLDTAIQVSPTLTTRIRKDHPFDQVIEASEFLLECLHF